jgi:hypothetical protein
MVWAMGVDLSLGRKRKRSASERHRPSGVRYLKIRKVLLTDEVDRWLGELASITKQSRSAVVRQLIADRKIRMGELFKIN